MNTDVKKLQELLKDEAFVNELLTKEEPEDVQALFEANGVEMSLDEVKAIGEMLDKVANNEISSEQLEKIANGELSEEELAEVAGGIGVAGTIAVTFAVALVAGGGVGAATAAVVENWKSIKRFFRRW